MDGGREGGWKRGRCGGDGLCARVRARTRAEARPRGERKRKAASPRTVRARTIFHLLPFPSPAVYPPAPPPTWTRIIPAEDHEKIRTREDTDTSPPSNSSANKPEYTPPAHLDRPHHPGGELRKGRAASEARRGRRNGPSRRRARSVLLLSYIIPAREVLSVAVIYHPGARGPFCCCHIASRRARSFLLLSYSIA